ncbi:MAG: carboxypeptidase regulatory-like domain-containing protein [Alphaproteobacteria bacterium]|nr:carboxypeptidase regulatory-like domain-containing protein [Alphaproteobacteria bacterium]
MQMWKFGTLALLALMLAFAMQPASAASISGTVTDEAGRPLSGVWVTAMTRTASSHPRRTVVSDGDGHYAITGLSGPGPYFLRTRVYGYKDKELAGIAPGGNGDIAYEAAEKLDAKQTAAQLPANYWFSLLDTPTPAQIEQAGYQDQRQWMGQLKLICTLCHQLGNDITRRPKSRDEWDAKLALAPSMSGFADALNRDVLLDVLAAWSDKIAGGALPAGPAPRPSGADAAYQMSEWDVGQPASYQHDFAAGYVWNPLIGAAPPHGAAGKWVYTGDLAWGTIYGVNIDTGETRMWEIPFAPAEQWGFYSLPVYPWKSHPHTLEVDRDGRLVILADISDEDPAMVYPSGNRDIVVFDPRTETWDPIMTRCDTHTLRLDLNGRYWLSGNLNMLCMYDPATGEERQIALPQTFEGFGGFLYGIDVAPDGTVWFSEPFSNHFGRYDPATDTVTQWEVAAPGYGPRRLRTDSKGNVWLPLVSGHLGKFDPATESFSFWETPGPKRAVPASGDDYHYNLFVDRTGNAGKKDTVYIAGTNSDSMIAFDPETETFASFRNPTRGFFTREAEAFDGAIWTVFSSDPAKHVEASPESTVPIPKLVRFDRTGG